MSASAYWLSPRGEIYEVEGKHINFMRDNLELFKLTPEQYRETYLKYGEKFGFEGKARQELFINAMKRGWCRLRDYGNRGWSLEVWEMDSYTKDLIFKWAMKTKGYLSESIKHPADYSDINKVTIHVIKDEQAGRPQSEWWIETTFADIRRGILYESKDFVMTFDNYSTMLYENKKV